VAAKKATSEEVVDIVQVSQQTTTFHLVGETPLIFNKMSSKARQELLLPRGRKTASERATTLKHDPIAEFLASPYTIAEEEAETYLAALSAWFKRAMSNAALDMAGARKAVIGRNIYVVGERLPLYGTPKLLMAVTRSADIGRTPDIRSRAIVPEWATSFTVRHTIPLLRGQMVTNLLAAAGMTVGVGDWRQEKGSGSYGLFRIVSEDDEQYQRIKAEGGRAVQQAAMEAPEPYDDETSELFSWFNDELSARRTRGVA